MVLLRYFNPIGAHESGRIGENPNGIPNNLMPYITKVAAGQLKRLSVYGDDYNTPDGTGVRDYIHVVDLAKGHVAACAFAAEHTGCGDHQPGHRRGLQRAGHCPHLLRVNGVDVPYVIASRRAGDIDACYADPSKAKRLLHWQAEKTLRICAGTAGAGRLRTPTVIRTKHPLPEGRMPFGRLFLPSTPFAAGFDSTRRFLLFHKKTCYNQF